MFSATWRTIAAALLLVLISAGPVVAQEEMPNEAVAEDVAPEDPIVGEMPVETQTAEEPPPVDGEAPAEETPADGDVLAITPEMQEVQKMQRAVPKEDRGENMRRRMQLGTEVPTAVVTETAVTAPQVYIVKPGDTLWDISARFLADPFKWPSVYQANPQIINPDLIYPGEPITIYPRDYEESEVRVVTLLPPEGLAREEEAPEELEEPVVEFEAIEELEPAPEDIAARQTYLEGLEKREEIRVYDEASAELISKKQATIRRRQKNVITYQLAPSAGWIDFLDGQRISDAGYILGQEDARARIRAASGDVVYINRGEIHGVAEKDRFTIFRVGREVEHPVNGDYMGHIIKIIGQFEVDHVYERLSAGRIIEAFEDVSVGNEQLAGIEAYDRVIPELEISKEIRLRPNDREIAGYIVANRENALSAVSYQIVYIDRGKKDGVEAGNVFTIFRPNREVADPEVGDRVQLPRFVIGEGVVLATSENTATMLITKASREIETGDQVKVSDLTLEPEDEAAGPLSAAPQTIQ